MPLSGHIHKDVAKFSKALKSAKNGELRMVIGQCSDSYILI